LALAALDRADEAVVEGAETGPASDGRSADRVRLASLERAMGAAQRGDVQAAVTDRRGRAAIASATA
jgi:hypothetical protein